MPGAIQERAKRTTAAIGSLDAERKAHTAKKISGKSKAGQ